MADYISQFTGGEIDRRLAKVSELEAGKQDKLVSGETIKTIGGQSVLGEGNIPLTDQEAVKFTPQTLTDAQKAQALANIGAASEDEVAALADQKYEGPYESAAALPTASASTMGAIYLVGPDGNGEYDRYVTKVDGSTYTWGSLGKTSIDLSNYATKAEVGELEAKVDEFIPIDVDKKYVSYSTGAISTAVSGFYIKEIPVIAGDVLVINTSLSYTSAAVIAMYKGGTYSQADSIKAGSIGNDLHDVTLTIPADVTKVIVGYQGNTPTSAYVKYYCKKWVDYISGRIKDSSYTKVLPTTESGYYDATVGSAISTASSSTFVRTPLIDIEGLKTIRVSFGNGKLNEDGSVTSTVALVILTDENNIVLYANKTFVNNSEINLSLYPTVKYLALVVATSRMDVAYEYHEVEKFVYESSGYAGEISTLKVSTTQLEGKVSSIYPRTFNSPFSVSRRYVLYETGELAAGTDGFKYEEINVEEGDLVRVFTKITPATAAIIAAYNGDTYVKSASILTNGQERTIDYVVPAGVNKLRVSAQYDLGTEQYYVKTRRYALYSETVFTNQDDGYYGNFPKYQDFVVGRQSILYLNNIGRKYEDTINEFYTSQAGYPPSGYIGSPLAISYTPATTGSTDITFVKKRNISDTLASRKITFRAVSKNTGNGETKNIIFIGDSLIASGDASEQVYNMLVEDADYAVNMLGDHETGSKVNAGHGSWSWADWINPAGESTPIYGMLNPFMHNGELDFANFMSVNYPSLSGIDIAVISLGTNDMAQGGGGIDKAQAAVANAKVFIDALLADYPNVKIAIGIPSCGAYSAGATGFAHYPQGFRNSILLYAKEMIDTFDNGAYHANVTCVFHGWFIDLDNDYPNTELTLPSGVKTKCVTNFIHPSAVGYRHWGVGYYNKIRAFLAGQL